jgi:16S rRNA (guanine527-N7)-methyltransferase
VEHTGTVSAAWLAERLAEPARALGVTLPAPACVHLAAYADAVLVWGSRVNLTGARSAEALADDHLADALALLPHLPPGPFSFVDVGSGAGLPGIVVALVREDAAGTLLEPNSKKRAFLAHAIRSVGLSGRVVARGERLEDHLETGGAGAYDVAFSRAVWPAADWLERAVPLLRPGGRALGLEGPTAGPLPAGTERHPYVLHGRPRSVLVRQL